MRITYPYTLSLRPFGVGIAFSLLASATTAQGYDFAAFQKYSDDRQGQAILIHENGKTIYEKYTNWTATTAHRLASGTKSFTGVLVAMAVDDGLLSFDERLVDTITEWKGATEREKITYRQLVGLISGLDGGGIGQVPTYADAIKVKMTGTAGNRFHYGPNPFQAFGEALKRKLAARPAKETVEAYIQRKLLTPLGLVVKAWTKKAVGEPNLPSGAFPTAREWIKFGEMVLNNGVYNGKRIVSARNLNQLFVGTSVKPTYGVGWWLPGASSVIPRDARMAKGAGKQRLFVFPALELVIVRFGETTGAFNDDAFIAALLPSRFWNVGAGCAGTVGTPRLLGDSLPTYGKTMVLRLDRIPANAVGLFFLGASKDLYLGSKLPFSLAPLGMTGCNLNISLDWSVPFKATNGAASFVLALPRNNSLPGVVGYFQALVLDKNANPAGQTVSNGLGVQVGVR